MDRPTAPADGGPNDGAWSSELELGDEDLIADGGTQIMSREPTLRSPSARALDAEPMSQSALDALAATIPAKRPLNVVITLDTSDTSDATPSRDAPTAAATQPIHELDPDDLEEEEQRRLERTQPFDRSRLFGAPHTSTLASFAPVAIDVPYAHPDATLKLPPVPHVPGLPKSNTPLIVGALGFGIALCAAVAIAIVSFTAGADVSERTKSTPTVAAKPREAQKGVVRSAVIETTETTPQKAAAPPGAQDEDGTPVYSPSALPSAPAYVGREAGGSAAPSSAQTSRAASTTAPARTVKPATSAAPPAVVPEPPPTPVVAASAAAPLAPATPSRPAAPPATTGTIEVPASLMTVMVDGDYKRVQGGRIVVSCGKHRVNAGRGTQVVDVPCGGVASVM